MYISEGEGDSFDTEHEEKRNILRKRLSEVSRQISHLQRESARYQTKMNWFLVPWVLISFKPLTGVILVKGVSLLMEVYDALIPSDSSDLLDTALIWFYFFGWIIPYMFWLRMVRLGEAADELRPAFAHASEALSKFDDGQ